MDTLSLPTEVTSTKPARDKDEAYCCDDAWQGREVSAHFIPIRRAPKAKDEVIPSPASRRNPSCTGNSLNIKAAGKWETWKAVNPHNTRCPPSPFPTSPHALFSLSFPRPGLI